TLDYRIIDPREHTLTGTDHNDTIVGRDDGSTISGLGGDDKLIGGVGNDVLDGGVGNDILDAGRGSDHLDGGAGINTASFKSVFGSVVVDLSAGTATGQGLGTLGRRQQVLGSGRADRITGDD